VAVDWVKGLAPFGHFSYREKPSPPGLFDGKGFGHSLQECPCQVVKYPVLAKSDNRFRKNVGNSPGTAKTRGHTHRRPRTRPARLPVRL